MIRMKMRKTGIFLMSLLSLALTGCHKEYEEQSGASRIRVRVQSNGTKGLEMTTSRLELAGQFVMDAYVDEEYAEFDENGVEKNDTRKAAGPYIVSDGNYNVSYSAGDWSLTSESYWIANDKIRFWCYYPQKSDINGTLVVTDAPASGKTKMSFTYTLPAHGTGAPHNDATNQQDLLLAYAEKTYIDESQSDEYIDINFNHPLSEVRFCISPDDGTYDINLKIKSISIINVPQQGTCTFDAGGTIAAKTMFEWKNLDAADKTFTQDYNVTFPTTDGFNNPPEGWTVGTFVDGTQTYHTYTCDDAFMLIPHTLSGAQLKVVFSGAGTGSDVIRTADLTNVTWSPGYFYTYKIQATTIGRDINMILVLDSWGNSQNRYLI